MKDANNKLALMWVITALMVALFHFVGVSGSGLS